MRVFLWYLRWYKHAWKWIFYSCNLISAWDSHCTLVTPPSAPLSQCSSTVLARIRSDLRADLGPSWEPSHWFFIICHQSSRVHIQPSSRKIPGWKEWRGTSSWFRGVLFGWDLWMWWCRSHQIRYWSHMCKCVFQGMLPPSVVNLLKPFKSLLIAIFLAISSSSALVASSSWGLSSSINVSVSYSTNICRSILICGDGQWLWRMRPPVVQLNSEGDSLWIDRAGQCQTRKYRHALPLTMCIPALSGRNYAFFKKCIAPLVTFAEHLL